MLDNDETDGCLQRKSGKRRLSSPHSVSLIDFDGDCLSDLFLTVTDASSGKNYYEIYLRRDKLDQLDSQDDYTSNSNFSDIRGLNTFCLVTREEIP